MSFDSGKELKEVLVREYGGFADKRIKKLDRGSLFTVDSRGPGDHGADKRLFPWFCAIFVDVQRNDEVEVRLIGGVPMDAAVKAWIGKHKATFTADPTKTLMFSVRKDDHNKLPALARAIASITGPGRRYGMASYKATSMFAPARLGL